MLFLLLFFRAAALCNVENFPCDSVPYSSETAGCSRALARRDPFSHLCLKSGLASGTLTHDSKARLQASLLAEFVEDRLQRIKSVIVNNVTGAEAHGEWSQTLLHSLGISPLTSQGDSLHDDLPQFVNAVIRPPLLKSENIKGRFNRELLASRFFEAINFRDAAVGIAVNGALDVLVDEFSTGDRPLLELLFFSLVNVYRPVFKWSKVEQGLQAVVEKTTERVVHIGEIPQVVSLRKKQVSSLRAVASHECRIIGKRYQEVTRWVQDMSEPTIWVSKLLRNQVSFIDKLVAAETGYGNFEEIALVKEEVGFILERGKEDEVSFETPTVTLGHSTLDGCIPSIEVVSLFALLRAGVAITLDQFACPMQDLFLSLLVAAKNIRDVLTAGLDPDKKHLSQKLFKYIARAFEYLSLFGMQVDGVHALIAHILSQLFDVLPQHRQALLDRAAKFTSQSSIDESTGAPVARDVGERVFSMGGFGFRWRIGSVITVGYGEQWLAEHMLLSGCEHQDSQSCGKLYFSRQTSVISGQTRALDDFLDAQHQSLQCIGILHSFQQLQPETAWVRSKGFVQRVVKAGTRYFEGGPEALCRNIVHRHFFYLEHDDSAKLVESFGDQTRDFLWSVDVGMYLFLVDSLLNRDEDPLPYLAAENNPFHPFSKPGVSIEDFPLLYTYLTRIIASSKRYAILSDSFPDRLVWAAFKSLRLRKQATMRLLNSTKLHAWYNRAIWTQYVTVVRQAISVVANGWQFHSMLSSPFDDGPGLPSVMLFVNRAQEKQNEAQVFSRRYWESRYSEGGNSGRGSESALGEYKAEFLAHFLKSDIPKQVLELGVGDGQQLKHLMKQDGLKIKKYVGVDVSPYVVQQTAKLFRLEAAVEILHDEVFKQRYYRFSDDGVGLDKLSVVPGPAAQFDVTVSFDVLYHLLENSTYDEYLRDLFGFSRQFVVIYTNQLHPKAFYYKQKFVTGMHVFLRPDKEICLERFGAEFQLVSETMRAWESSKMYFYVFQRYK